MGKTDVTKMFSIEFETYQKYSGEILGDVGPFRGASRRIRSINTEPHNIVIHYTLCNFNSTKCNDFNQLSWLIINIILIQ